MAICKWCPWLRTSTYRLGETPLATAAREKQKIIKERFRSWVFADPDRTEKLVRIYNDTYNNLRPRLFDGSHLDYPGMNQNIKLRPHQDDAVWRGMSSGNTLHAHTQFAPEIYLEGATTRLATLSREHHGPLAVLNALERLAGGYGSECDRVRRDLGIAESQLRDYEARLGKPFLHETYLAELTTLRDQLKAGLSGAPQEPGKEEGPSVSELSERIKALKAGHSVEAPPQRDRQKHASAEEPITARIRRRAEAHAPSHLLSESEFAPDAEGVRSRGSIQNSSLDPPRTFQERIILERKSKDDGPSPP